MRTWLRWSIALLALMVLLGAVAPAAHARPLEDDKVVFGGTYVLPEGEVLEGNLRVVGGDATVSSGARVTGDVTVLGGELRIEGVVEGNLSVTGGTATVNGTVYGDVQVLGGNINFGPDAVVMGAVHQIGGEVNRDPAAQVNVLPDFPNMPDMPDFPNMPEVPEPPRPPRFVAPHPSFVWPHTSSPADIFVHTLWEALLALLRAIAMAVLAGVVFLFPHTFAQRTVALLESTPLLAGGAGLLTLALLPVVLVALVITLVLIPLALVLAVVVGVSALYGWLVLGWYLGERLTQALRQAWHPAVNAALGTFVLTLLAAGMNIVPCIGWVAGFLIGSVGLGAVILALWEAWQQQSRARTAASAPPAEEA